MSVGHKSLACDGSGLGLSLGLFSGWHWRHHSVSLCLKWSICHWGEWRHTSGWSQQQVLAWCYHRRRRNEPHWKRADNLCLSARKIWRRPSRRRGARAPGSRRSRSSFPTSEAAVATVRKLSPRRTSAARPPPPRPCSRRPTCRIRSSAPPFWLVRENWSSNESHKHFKLLEVLMLVHVVCLTANTSRSCVYQSRRRASVVLPSNGYCPQSLPADGGSHLCLWDMFQFKLVQLTMLRNECRVVYANWLTGDCRSIEKKKKCVWNKNLKNVFVQPTFSFIKQKWT